MLRVIQLIVFVLTLGIFITMSVSCPSGLCLSASLPLVTSQARLESDVLEPQPGVTAGFRRMFQALGGQDRYPAVPSDLPQYVSPSVMAPLIRQSGSASAYWFSFVLGSPPSAGYQSDVCEPQPGVTAGFAVCSRLWVFRTGIQRSLLSPVSRLGSALGLH